MRPPARCAHGTAETPCCAACATLHQAEDVLRTAQTTVHPDVPRGALERRLLDTLRQWYPLPVSCYQLASLLGHPREETRKLCQALYTLGTIEHTSHGHYRHKPTTEEEGA